MIRNIFRRRKEEDPKAEEPAEEDGPEAPAAEAPAPDIRQAPAPQDAEAPPVDTRAAEPPAPVEAPAPEKKGWFSRLKAGLSRSAGQLGGNITAVFKKRRLDDEALEELEELLIQADLGVAVAGRVTQRLAKEKFDKDVTDAEIRAALAEEVTEILSPLARPLEIGDARPHVVLVVGVNGTGKTTTIGKLAEKFRHADNKVVLAAGDTFRAAAIEQLQIWGERTGAAVVSSKVGADAAGLAFDALQKAKAEGADVLLIDTAGRLQNKADLMAELQKINRVLKKLVPEAPHTVLLTLDATTGQNALRQVEVFREMADVSGLVMTKLDGTARGGVLVAVAEKFGLPVHFIGVGEGADDLQPFAAEDFARALVGTEEA
ncbi:signal recognition particle-docking protein FtsY [Marinibaculum pumilum]|uniref:Signal recognition particle receptor FtsY n=1 Tax=Marinibaculum pumilum TaxID=1766165 RepID=A0ABV7L1Q3_9PROT